LTVAEISRMYSRRPTFKAAASVNGVAAPFVALKSYAFADPGYARVAITVTHRADSMKNRNTVFTAIAGLFDHKATPVSGSWLSSGKHDLFEDLVGMMSSNKQVVAYDPNSTAFRSISSNMFMDDERNMWTLKETEGGKLFVRTSAYDDEKVLEELMASLSSNNGGHSGYNGNLAVDVAFRQALDGGTYVTYVSKSGADEVRSGYVASTVCDDSGKTLNDVIVIGRTAESYEVIDRNMVISVCSSDDMPTENEAQMTATAASSMRSNVSLEDIIAYYKTLFSRLHSHFYG
jgi:hypothetical protein